MTATPHTIPTPTRRELRGLSDWRSELAAASRDASAVMDLVQPLNELAVRLDADAVANGWREAGPAGAVAPTLALAAVAAQVGALATLVGERTERLATFALAVANAPEPGDFDRAVVEVERAERERWTDAPDTPTAGAVPPQWARYLHPVGDNERASAATALGAVIKLDPTGADFDRFRSLACVELGPEVADAVTAAWRLLCCPRTARRVRAIAERVSGGER